MLFCSEPSHENRQCIHTSSTTGNIDFDRLSVFCMRNTTDSFKKNGDNILKQYIRQPYI